MKIPSHMYSTHSTQTCGRDGGHYATHLNNLITKLQLSQCHKFKLFSLSQPGAVCGRNTYTTVHHSHFDTVRLWLTVRSHSDAICGRNKYTVVHHSHFDTVRLRSTVLLSYPEAICNRSKYAVVQYTHYITAGPWETFWHILEVQITKISTQCYIIPTILLLNHNRLLCQSYELHTIKICMQ
jgi:hypothetical protein